MDSSQDNVVPIINSNLNDSKSRQNGIEILLKNLPHFSNEVMLKYLDLWMSKIIQELENINNDRKQLNKICQTISALIIRAKTIPELNKTVSMQYIKQLLNTITNLESCKQCGGVFYLLSVILYYYPEISGRSQILIQKMIIPMIDSTNKTLVACAAKNYTLLSIATQRSFKPPSHKSNYTGYMYDEYLICNTLNEIIDEVFLNLTDNKDNQNVETLDLPVIPQDNVIEYFETVERRICNLCTYLSTMLETHMNKTSVSTSDILNLLSRCYELILQNRSDDSVRIQYIEKMLYTLYDSLSSVLNAFIIGFGPDLLPYAVPILQLIFQTFLWSKNISKKISNLNYLEMSMKVQTAAYKSLATWLKYCGPATAIEYFADKFLPFILKDVIPERTSVVLGVQNKQHMSKKALKKFKTKQQEKQNCTIKENQINNPDFNLKCNLCIGGLIALQQIIIKGNHFLKGQFYETVHYQIIPFAYSLYTLSDQNNCYKLDVRCRKELFNTLNSFVISPHPNTPLPIANIMEIYKMAQNDYNQEIIETAELGMNILEKICHPTAPTLFSPVKLKSSHKRNATSFTEETCSSVPHKRQNIIPLLEDSITEDLDSTNLDCSNDTSMNVNENSRNRPNTNASLYLHSEILNRQSVESSTPGDDNNDIGYKEKDSTTVQMENLNTHEKECVNVEKENSRAESTIKEKERLTNYPENYEIMEIDDNLNEETVKCMTDADSTEKEITPMNVEVASNAESINAVNIIEDEKSNGQSEATSSDDEEDVNTILQLFHSEPKSDYET